MLLVLWYLAEALHEIEQLRAGLVESIRSEDYNRDLRYQAEARASKMWADRQEAMNLALALWMTCVVPGRALDVLRMERRVQNLEREIETLQRSLSWQKAENSRLRGESEEWGEDED